MRHEVFCDAIVWTIEQYFHGFILLSQLAGRAGSDVAGLSRFGRSAVSKTDALMGTAGGVRTVPQDTIIIHGTSNDY
jgi:hypothetical protein